ncbi:MAG TPA: D-glycero-beta-D-manno-heptose 1-phosphate adenylyltransferase [Bacteroidetes bacterium]|mgnify:FL=1|nr:D-glycero-beta-D-manno-heptose 1-phosphate adenylyltransferase [Bacteroidota bacterium]HRK05103.1 D-glycero-beta-D-manno-heptose 1-phosphate adenylyltransferase [Chlorobiota bacterium]
MIVPSGKDLSDVLVALQPHRGSIVFTNGVFDILHAGHVTYLQAARDLGTVLVVGVNADASVRRLKGPDRPINPWEDRATVLAALRSVDHVIYFDDDTPLRLITAILPDVLVKGGDYQRDTIVGADIVEEHGGRVLTIDLLEGRSTTNIISRARKA